MKKENVYILNDSLVDRVCKLGIIDFGYHIGKCEITVNGFEDDCEPHFHINGIDSAFHTNICIYNEAYFIHNQYEKINKFSEYIESIENHLYKTLNDWLNIIFSYNIPKSNKEYIKDMWEILNPDWNHHKSRIHLVDEYNYIGYDIALIKGRLKCVPDGNKLISKATLGAINLPDIGLCEITINEFEDEFEPHIHINNINNSFCTSICLLDNKYYPHDDNIICNLTQEQAKILNSWFQQIGFNYPKTTNWGVCKISWNDCNFNNKIMKRNHQPDYSIIL